MTIQFQQFNQSEFKTRLAQVESIYMTTLGYVTASANPYRLYAADLLPANTDYFALPGAVEHFSADNFPQAATKYAEAVKAGFTAIHAENVSPTYFTWRMHKSPKAYKADMEFLATLVKERYESDIEQFNADETERQLELMEAAHQRAKVKVETDAIAERREQFMAELKKACAK